MLADFTFFLSGWWIPLLSSLSFLLYQSFSSVSSVLARLPQRDSCTAGLHCANLAHLYSSQCLSFSGDFDCSLIAGDKTCETLGELLWGKSGKCRKFRMWDKVTLKSKYIVSLFPLLHLYMCLWTIFWQAFTLTVQDVTLMVENKENKLCPIVLHYYIPHSGCVYFLQPLCIRQFRLIFGFYSKNIFFPRTISTN